MEIRPLDASDPGAMAAWYAAYHAADTHGREHPTPWTLEEWRANFTGERPGEDRVPVALHVDGEVVACGLVELPLQDNLDLAWGSAWTHPAHRGRGHGTAVLDHLLDVARDRGRTTFTTEVFVPYDSPEDGAGHPDADWALRRGFVLDISNVVRVLDLPVDEEQVQRLADDAAPHHGDYTLRQFRGPIPDDIVEAFGRLVGALMVEAPSGQVEKEHEVMDVARIRADEAVFEASGRTKYTTVAVAPDGELAAYSELVVPRHDPLHVYQWGTLVVPAHRGHRLGVATKVHNLQWLQQEAPDRTALVTFNAEVNQHMVAINEALGFRPVEREVELVRAL
jgi:GNAT superfamily N-acetyltransferase